MRGFTQGDLFPAPATRVDLGSYNTIIVGFSGGKDSTACVLHLLAAGVPVSKIELWHHLVDGREGSALMDWPVTESYCKQFADHFGIPIFFSWKVGGFEREMLKENARTAPTKFEMRTDDGGVEIGVVGGIRGKIATRRKFPQVSGDLRTRWCTPYLKIDPCSTAIVNQERFNGCRTLMITGERMEESPMRARYKAFEPDRADNREGKKKRYVDRWRPVHRWDEARVWEIMKSFQVNPHPAYRLGWARLSCWACVFMSADQFASLNAISPGTVQALIGYEKEFGVTMKRRESLPELLARGEPYPAVNNPGMVRMALTREYAGKITEERWELPAGAFGENAGPY